VAGCYEHGNEASSSIKCGKFDLLSDLDSQEGLCSMELVLEASFICT
jgi:hypothetical protein